MFFLQIIIKNINNKKSKIYLSNFKKKIDNFELFIQFYLSFIILFILNLIKKIIYSNNLKFNKN